MQTCLACDEEFKVDYIAYENNEPTLAEADANFCPFCGAEPNTGEIFYRRIDMPSDEPLQFVGVHPVRWHSRPTQPTAGFVEARYNQRETPEVRAAGCELDATQCEYYGDGCTFCSETK